MSLLNDMLKDLDKHRLGKKLSLYSTRTNKSSSVIPNISPWVILPFILAIFFLSGLYYFKAEEGSNRTQIDAIPAPVYSRHSANEQATAVYTVVDEDGVYNKAGKSSTKNTYVSQLIAIPQLVTKPISEPKSYTVNKVFSQLSEKEWQDEQLNLALDSIKEGNDFEAENILNNIIEKFPESVPARESLIALYLNQRNFPKAQLILDEGLAMNPRDLVLNMQKARMLFEQEQNEAALTVLKSFHPNINRSPDFYGLKAAILEALGHAKEAGMIYQFLIKIEPNNGKYWFGYALDLENKHAVIQAIAAYKQALESMDLDPEIQDYALDKIKTLQG